MNEVPDSSLGRLGVSTQHPPPTPQNHHCRHADSTLPFPQRLRVVRKLFQNYKKSKIVLLLSESQGLCHIFTTGLTRRDRNLGFDEFNSKTPKESLTCRSRGIQSCSRSPGVSHSCLPLSCTSFQIRCGISYSSECLCLGTSIALQTVPRYNFTLRLVWDEMAEFAENFLFLLGSQQQSVLGEQNTAEAG